MWERITVYCIVMIVFKECENGLLFDEELALTDAVHNYCVYNWKVDCGSRKRDDTPQSTPGHFNQWQIWTLSEITIFLPPELLVFLENIILRLTSKILKHLISIFEHSWDTQHKTFDEKIRGLAVFCRFQRWWEFKGTVEVISRNPRFRAGIPLIFIWVNNN